MPFKVVVTGRPGSGGIEPFEQTCTQPSVKIGRGEENDIVLRDPRRIVSAHHAEIRQGLHGMVLLDSQSRNGTLLNDEPLEPDKEYPLRSQDRIAIGDYALEVHLLPAQPESQPETHAVDTDATVCLTPGTDPYQSLVQRLRQTWMDHAEYAPEERKGRLVEVLRQEVQSVGQGQADQLLLFVQASFPDPAYQRECVLQGLPSEPIVPPSRHKASPVSSGGAVAYKVVGQYLRSEPSMPELELSTRVLERLEALIPLLVEFLSGAIKGRRQFEQEFEVMVTRIFSKAPNPMKQMDSAAELGAYLFDVNRTDLTTSDIAQNLRRVLDDLLMHQVGVMAGFQKCLQAILQRLDPADIEAESRITPFRLGFVPVPRTFPFRSWMAWEEYKQRYRKFTEEEVRAFEQELAPSVERAYLRIHERSKTS